MISSPDFSRVPAELKALDRWVCWRMENSRKVPYDARALSACASSTDPATWASFAEACAAYEERMFEADAFSGVGFVLNQDGLVGIDIDHCVLDGEPKPEAIDLLAGLNAAYVEISPSGTGLRAFGYAEPLEVGCKGMVNGLAVELYSGGRYLTLTGQALKVGALTRLEGFADLAQCIRADRHVDPTTGETLALPQSQRHAELVRRVLSGDVFHDSLRDLAASMVGSGMAPGAAVNHLHGLMDACSAAKDKRWEARRAEIPGLVASAQAKFAPEDFSALIARAEQKEQQRFKLLTGEDLASFPPLKWCVRGVLPEQGLAALYGPSGSGKSFLALDLITALGEGRPWFGLRVQQRPVVYVALEGEAGVKVRVQAWEAHHRRALPDAVRMVLQPFKLTDASDVAELGTTILSEGGRGAVIILDTLNRAAPNSDENSSKDMGVILDAAKKLQRLTDGLVVLVHHTGKNAASGMRGHSSLFAALDASIEVTRDGANRAWSIAKSKDGQDGYSHAFQLQQVPLGQDEHGDPITSCVCLPLDDQQIERKRPLTPRQQEGITSLCRAAIEFGEDTQDGRQVQVQLESWRVEFYRCCTADGSDAKRAAFTRVRQDLVSLGHVSVLNDWYLIDASKPELSAMRLTQKKESRRQADDRTNSITTELRSPVRSA